MKSGNFKLIGLQVDGMRKLRAIEMQFAERGLIKIVGQNKQGKTTILESLAVLIGGKKYLKDGAINPDVERIKLVGELDCFKIEREYYQDKEPSLKVTKKDGEILKGEVQSILSAIVNNLTYSPFPFINKTPLEKMRFLMDLYGIDFTLIDKELTTLEADRLYTGRRVREFGVLVEPDRIEYVDLTELRAKLKAIKDHNTEIDTQWENQRKSKKAEIDQYNEIMRLNSAKITKLTVSADAVKQTAESFKTTQPINDYHKECLDKQIAVFQGLYQDYLARIEQMPAVEPEKIYDELSLPRPEHEITDAVDEEIQKSEATNLKAEIYGKYMNRLKEKQDLQAEYQRLDEQIDKLREKKITVLAGIDTRVKGLEIKYDKESDQCEVCYFGIDTENLSDAEKITLSLQLCAAMTPDLRAIFIDRGESIDKDGQAALHQWAVENDIQLILSVVDEIPETSEEGCFYIVEGTLVEPETYVPGSIPEPTRPNFKTRVKEPETFPEIETKPEPEQVSEPEQPLQPVKKPEEPAGSLF